LYRPARGQTGWSGLLAPAGHFVGLTRARVSLAEKPTF
jgi:hypothetical protein